MYGRVKELQGELRQLTSIDHMPRANPARRQYIFQVVIFKTASSNFLENDFFCSAAKNYEGNRLAVGETINPIPMVLY